MNLNFCRERNFPRGPTAHPPLPSQCFSVHSLHSPRPSIFSLGTTTILNMKSGRGFPFLPAIRSAMLRNGISITRHQIVCDGNGGHEWLRFNHEFSNFTFHVKWRFTPVTTAEPKYNSGVFFRNNLDGSIWHQAQTSLGGGYIFGLTPVDGKPQGFNLQKEMKANRVKPARPVECLRYPVRRRYLHARGQRGSRQHRESRHQ